MPKRTEGCVEKLYLCIMLPKELLKLHAILLIFHEDVNPRMSPICFEALVDNIKIIIVIGCEHGTLHIPVTGRLITITCELARCNEAAYLLILISCLYRFLVHVNRFHIGIPRWLLLILASWSC